MRVGQDRRRFFRIDDHIGVSYRLLEEREVAAQLPQLSQPVDSLQQLAECNKQIGLLLGQLRARDPLVAKLAGLLDQKLDCVIQQLELESQMTHQLAGKVQDVNISASGLAMSLNERLATGAVLELEMLLLPSRFMVHCHGVVVSQERQTGGDGFFTRIEFRNLRPDDQETLIQHVLRRQGVLLKGQRDEEFQSGD